MIPLAVNMKRRLTFAHFPLAVHAFHEGLLILNSESHTRPLHTPNRTSCTVAQPEPLSFLQGRRMEPYIMYGLLWSGSGSGNRTHTHLAVKRLLRPLCIPVSPSRHRRPF